MNNVILSGRLTKDPEYTPQNGDKKSVVKITLAVDKKNGADFIPCTAFDSTADFINKYFKKGNRAFVQGKIDTGSYTNKENVTVYTWGVSILNIEFGESKHNTDENNQ